MQWSMKYNEEYGIFINVLTTKGRRYLRYTSSNTDSGPNGGGYIHHGLGVDSKNGIWQTFHRDLSADIKKYESDNELIAVDSLLIRGSGRIDDIELLDTMPLSPPIPKYTIYEDSKAGDTDGWEVYDNNPSGATISNVYNTDKESSVIELNGDGTNNGYRIGHSTATSPKAWNNKDNKVIKWSMNFNEVYYIYVAVETTKGTRLLQYTSGTTDKGLNGKYIHHGLGVESKNGTWQTVTRDLEADLKEFESDNTITSVNGMLIKGSGMLDDVSLLKDITTVIPSKNYKTITHNGFTYGTVKSPFTGKIWLDRNLGATRACTSIDDKACFGDYYQWGRAADGHESIDSLRSTTQATDINNSGSRFISSRSFEDWAIVDLNGSQRIANWSSSDGSVICPSDYRVPTLEELKVETLDEGVSNKTSAYNNFLKFPSAGYSEFGYLAVKARVFGAVWVNTSSELHDAKSRNLVFHDIAHFNHTLRKVGYNIRCVKDISRLDKGLLAHYEFEENTDDTSGNDRHATDATDTLKYENGVIGQSASFDGATKVVADDFKGFDWGKNFSVSVWFKRTGEWNNYQGIVNTGYHNSGSWEVRLGRESGGTWLGAGIDTGSGATTWTNPNFAAQNGWHHSIMTYDGNTLSTYLDNEVISTNRHSKSIVSTNNPLTIGENGGGWEYFYGLIDDVRLYDRALSADEAESLYKMGAEVLNNISPVSIAGDDQNIVVNNDVIFDASESFDEDGVIASYSWSYNDSVISTDMSFSKSDFSVGTHTVILTVTDSEGATATDEVIITVKAENIAPVADAGESQYILVGSIITLDGRGSSDEDGYITRYTWTLDGKEIGGSEYFPIGGFSIGTHFITLTVRDNEGKTDTDTTVIFVNEAPVARAGNDQTVLIGTEVTLDGSASTDNWRVEWYTWTEGGTVLSKSTNSSFSKSDFSVGTHTITLTVQDGGGYTDIDTVVITVELVSCNSSASCYALSESRISHTIHGELTKVNGYWRDSNGYYLSKSKDFWETSIAELGTLNEKTGLYYKYPTPGQGQAWSAANKTCRDLGWRLPVAGEVGTSGDLSHTIPIVGIAGGVPPYGGAPTWTGTKAPSGLHWYWSNAKTAQNPSAPNDEYALGVACVK